MWRPDFYEKYILRKKQNKEMPTILALTDIFGCLEEQAMEGKVEIDVWTRPKQHMSIT